MFCIKKNIFKNFAKLTGKHLCWSLFLKKVAGWRPAALLKKKLRRRRFPVTFAKFFYNSFLQNTSRRLLFYVGKVSVIFHFYNGVWKKTSLRENIGFIYSEWFQLYKLSSHVTGKTSCFYVVLYLGNCWRKI